LQKGEGFAILGRAPRSGGGTGKREKGRGKREKGKGKRGFTSDYSNIP
jgi:hypothetical protein